MKKRGVWGWLSIAVFCAASARAAPVVDQGAELLDGRDCQALALITGFHSVQNKKAGFHARLLEADGSATVAWDPVALFLVVRSGETPNAVVHTWRLARSVARVRGFVATQCGADVRVDVDRFISEGEVHGTTPSKLRLCFLGADEKLQERLQVIETLR